MIKICYSVPAKGINAIASRLYFITVLFSFFVSYSNGQSVLKPEIDKMCPDITFKQIQHYSKSESNVQDFRGKWLIMDFWSANCVACIERFPQMSEIQNRLGDSLQILLIGKDDSNTRKIYEKFRVKQNLNLPIVYDNTIFNIFNVVYVPQVVIVDPLGKLIAMTQEIDLPKAKELITGKVVPFPVKDDNKYKIPFDQTKPFLVNGNGEDDSYFLFRSLISPWNPKMEHFLQDFSEKYNWKRYSTQGIQIIGAPLEQLYRIAYAGTQHIFQDSRLYGNFWQFPILKVRNPSIFQYDPYTGQNIFCYSLIVPPYKAANDELREIMKQNLKTYFGFNAVVKKKRMPCWKLVVKNKKAALLLKTKGGKAHIPNKESAGITITNLPMDMLINQLWFYHQQEAPIIDATNIDYNIDISLDAIMTNLTDVTTELRKNGLDLIKSTRKMNVIIVTDY